MIDLDFQARILNFKNEDTEVVANRVNSPELTGLERSSCPSIL